MPIENTNPDYWFNQGQVSQASSFYYAAINHYGIALKLQPDYIPAHQALELLVQYIDWNNGQKYWDHLARLYNEIITIYPDYSVAIQAQLARLEMIKLFKQSEIYKHYCNEALAFARKPSTTANHQYTYNHYYNAVMYAQQWSQAADQIYQYYVHYYPETAGIHQDEAATAAGMLELSAIYFNRAKQALSEVIKTDNLPVIEAKNVSSDLQDSPLLKQEQPHVVPLQKIVLTQNKVTENTALQQQEAVIKQNEASNTIKPVTPPAANLSHVSYKMVLMANLPLSLIKPVKLHVDTPKTPKLEIEHLSSPILLLPPTEHSPTVSIMAKKSVIVNPTKSDTYHTKVAKTEVVDEINEISEVTLDKEYDKAQKLSNHPKPVKQKSKKSKKSKKLSVRSEIAVAILPEQDNTQASELDTRIQSYLQELASHRDEGRLDAAIETCGKIMQESRNNDLYRYKAYCEMGILAAFSALIDPNLKEQYDQNAAQYFSNALTLCGQESRELPDAYYEMGTMYFYKKDYIKAKEYYKIALSKEANLNSKITVEGYPSCIVKAHYQLGEIIAQSDLSAIIVKQMVPDELKLLKEMEDHYSAVKSSAQHFPSLCIRLAEISALKEEWDDVIFQYEAIINNTEHFNIFSDAAKAGMCYQCGKAYGSKKPRDINKVIELFEKMVALYPNHPEIAEINKKIDFFKNLKIMGEARKAGITGITIVSSSHTAHSTEIMTIEPNVISNKLS